MPARITSSANPIIKQVRSLRQKKGREESGLFLVEGIHHVGEAVEAGWDIEAILYTPALLESPFAKKLVEDEARHAHRVIELPAELFTSLAEKDNPQGLMALVHQRQWTLDQVDPLDTFTFGAAVVSPQDPGNLGTILRTLDAVDGRALFLLDGGTDAFHPSSVRASMGAIFWKPVVETSFEELVQWAHRKNISMIGTSAHAGTSFHELSLVQPPAILVFGSEQKGLASHQLEACDMRVSLPMHGRASSLNLAVAAGILLYALMEKKLQD